MRARITHLAAAALVGIAAAAPAGAQSQQSQPTDTRWRAWVGCWQAVGVETIGPAEGQAGRVCVVPTSETAVEIINVAGGAVASRTQVDGSGAPRTIGREGCTGVERAEWSADRERVYLKAEITCDGIRRVTSGILAFSPNGEWMDVQGVTTGGNSGVHVARYYPLSDLSGIPAEVTRALPQTALAVATARAAATSPVDADDVLDATRHADAAVVEAWLVERGQGFKLDAKRLVSLADAGVPSRVTDLMVALSYPRTFAINRSAREAELARTERAEPGTAVTGRTIYADAYGYSPFGWGSYAYGSRYRYGYGYSPYGYGGYSPYGYGGYSPPIIIVRGNDQPAGETVRPRVVNGRGYTEGRSTPTSTGSTNSGSSSGNTRSDAGSSSSSGGSSGSSSSGSGERTAKPRSP